MNIFRRKKKPEFHNMKDVTAYLEKELADVENHYNNSRSFVDLIYANEKLGNLERLVARIEEIQKRD